MNKEKLLNLIDDIALKIEENKQFLTDLDAAIADGDHGLNLAKGFNEVEKKLNSSIQNDCGSILKNTGMTLVSTVGGASGPLFGTAFMKSGMVIGNKEEIDSNDFIKMLEASIEGIEQRGRAVKGEKTMLDALIPAFDAYKEAINNKADEKKAMLLALNAAKEGVEYTKTIAATKGRASYIGERSIGHQDPGATSVMLIFECIYNCL